MASTVAGSPDPTRAGHDHIRAIVWRWTAVSPPPRKAKRKVLACSLERHPRSWKCGENEGAELANLTPDSLPSPAPSGPSHPSSLNPPQLPRPAPHPLPAWTVSAACRGDQVSPGRAKMQPGLWLLLAAQLTGKPGRLAGRAGLERVVCPGPRKSLSPRV